PSAAPGSDGAVLTIDAGNAVDENGATYTGEVLISEVAAERTPIALGDRRQPAYLITVQPAGVEFDTPAPVSFPNVDGHPAFARMPLLGLNHDTGEFEATGLLEVSADGERLVTVTGGVSTSSWYLPNPNPPSGEPCCSGDGAPPDADGDGIPDSKDPDFPGNDQNNEDLAPGDCAETAGSSVALSDGDLRIYHSLVTYVSKGINRGLHFTYTLHGAAPRPQVRARFTLPGNDPNQPGALSANASQISHSLKLDGVPIGERIFTSTDLGQEDTSYFRDLSFDASDVPTGVYGLTIATTSEFSSSSFASEFPRNLMIWNARLSAIGVGWGVGETARIYQGSITGYVLLARGDGSMAAFLAPSSGVGVAISPRGEFSSLEFLADGSFEFRADDGSIESYNAEGLLVTITGPLGDFSTLAYDTSFRLTELIDPAGLSTTLSYAGALLDTTTDPGGRVTRFVHDPQGHLVQIIDPDGASRGFSYNSLGQLTSQVSPSGETTTYNIADNGSVQSIELPDGTVRVLSPALLQGLQLPEQGEGIELAPGPLQIVGETAGSFIDGQGNVFTTEINSLGQPTSRTGPDGATVRFEYDGTGNLQEMSDPADAIITFEYDEDRERLVSRTVLDSATGEIIVTGIQYDETTDLPSAILHPDGGQSSFTWDADSLLTGLSDPLGRATTLTYDTDGAVASATTPSGALTTWQRDSQGLLVSATGPDGNTTSYTRDSLGRMTERIDADGGSTQFSWDDGNSLTSVTDPAGGVSNFTYDAARRRTSYSDPEGRLTEFTYDGRPKKPLDI
ncbi:MAG TPA: RHS repeat protein, partial [Acidobacteria bacterium]|nr:RHS repeat protein [Acidobacteriota bacterium]